MAAAPSSAAVALARACRPLAVASAGTSASSSPAQISTAAPTPSHCITAIDSVSAPRKEPSVDQYSAAPLRAPARSWRSRLVRIGTVCPSSHATGHSTPPTSTSHATGAGCRWANSASTTGPARPTAIKPAAIRKLRRTRAR